MLLTQIALAFHLCNLSFGFSPHSFFLAFCVIIHIHRMNFSVLFFLFAACHDGRKVALLQLLYEHRAKNNRAVIYFVALFL